LRADVAQSPYVAVQNGRLRIDALDLHLDTLSDQERMALQKALARALVQIGHQRTDHE
jgi:hypothetical protein